MFIIQNNNSKKIFAFLIILFILFAFFLRNNLLDKDPKVNKHIQRSEKEVIKYVQNTLSKKYPNITVNLEKKEQAMTYPTFYLTGANYKKIKGAYEYTFSIKDNNDNYAIAIYTDGYTYNDKKYDNEIKESYQNNINMHDELLDYSKIIEPYLNFIKIIGKHYSAGSIEEGMYDNVRIIYDLNLDYYNLDYTTYACINSFGYDIRAFESIEHNWFSYKDPEIYFDFNDKKAVEIYTYGIGNSSKLEQNYTEITQNNTDYYLLKKYFNSNFSEKEVDNILLTFNSKAKDYINEIKDIQVQTYNSNDGNKYYKIILYNYTRNHYLSKIEIICKYNGDANLYEGFEIKLVEPSGYSELSKAGTIIRTWKIQH